MMCKCWINHGDGDVEEIVQCPLCKAAPDLMEACEGLVAVLKVFNYKLQNKHSDAEIVAALDNLLDQYGAIANNAIAKATE